MQPRYSEVRLLPLGEQQHGAHRRATMAGTATTRIAVVASALGPTPHAPPPRGDCHYASFASRGRIRASSYLQATMLLHPAGIRVTDPDSSLEGEERD